MNPEAAAGITLEAILIMPKMQIGLFYLFNA
jgi:hypothetical protein